MPDPLNIKRIADLRAERQLTQAEAAAASGLSRQRWNDIEQGRHTNIELKTLVAIAGALGCDPCELLTKPAAKRPKAK